MADSRPAEDLTATVANLRRDLEDRIATLMARSNRRPVGTIELTLRTASLPYGTLVLNGAAVSRTTYADLWAWANDTGALSAGFFGVGDGSTTFTLPNLGGKFVVGAGASGYDPGTTGGAASVTLTSAQMPSHSHTGTTGIDTSAHQHPMTHGGHFPGSSFTAAAGADLGLAAWNSSGTNSPTWTGDPDASHVHGFTTGTAGSGGSHENRPPFIAIYYAIWF